jgi:hypothetical protein
MPVGMGLLLVFSQWPDVPQNLWLYFLIAAMWKDA